MATIVLIAESTDAVAIVLIDESADAVAIILFVESADVVAIVLIAESADAVAIVEEVSSFIKLMVEATSIIVSMGDSIILFVAFAFAMYL